MQTIVNLITSFSNTNNNDVFAAKHKQSENIDIHESKNTETVLYGSVGKCEIDEDRKIITKTIHSDVERASLNLKILHIATSIFLKSKQPIFNQLSEDIKLEMNLVNEHKMLTKFYNAWKDVNDHIKVPKSMGEPSSDILKMEYYDWKRLDTLKEVPREILDLIILFFFNSIEKYKLIHGDMSFYNILVSDDKKSICVVDYGLSKEITEKQYIGLKIMEQKDSFGSMLSKTLKNKNHKYTQKWYDDVNNDYDRKPNSKIICPEISVIFARSVLNMTEIMLKYSK